MPVVLVCEKPSISDRFAARGTLAFVGRTLIHPFWAVEPHGVRFGRRQRMEKGLGGFIGNPLEKGIVVSRGVNAEEYLLESRPTASPMGNSRSAEREPINTLVWQNLGIFDWLRFGEDSSANLRLTDGSNHFTTYNIHTIEIR